MPPIDSAAVLRAFAELAPTGRQSDLDVTSGVRPLVWLGLVTSLVGRWTE